MRFLSIALSALAFIAPTVTSTLIDVPFGATFIGTPDDSANAQTFVEGGKTVIDDSNFVYDLPSIGSVVSVQWKFGSSNIPPTVFIRTFQQKSDEHWRFKMIDQHRIDNPTNLDEFAQRDFWNNAIDIPYGSLSIDNGHFVGFYFPDPVDIVNVYMNTTVPDYNKVEWVMPGNFTDTDNWSPEPKFYFPNGYTTGVNLATQRRLDDGQYSGGTNPDMNLVSWYFISSWYQYVQTNPALYPITSTQNFAKSNANQPDPTKWNEGFISRGNHKDAFKFVVRVIQRDGSTHGDPQFAGFQGQNFQFHGMADEVFNLISTPKFQLNGNFKYLSSGKCDYNETECYTHPGTYVDQLGFTIGDIKIKAVAGSHEKGLRVWMNDIEFHSDANMKAIFSIFNSTEQTGFLKHPSKGKFIVDTPHFTIQATNSDYFFNIEVALKHTAALMAGQKKVSLKQKFLCMSEGQNVATRLSKVEDFMANYYPRFPIHGLIGQTWRNVDICGHAWVGDASDYVTSGLFATDSVFNYYGQNL